MMQSNSPPHKLSREDIKARLRLADQPKASMETEDPPGAQFVLNVMQIRHYDKNPRQSVYEDFNELKEGIRTQGFNGAFPVTRRPSDNTYMLAHGHNQRLRAVQELWQETNDPQFRDVPVVYVQWTSESNNLARHLSENINRSDMTFWDKATGFLSFKQTREAEIGTSLSLRKLEEEAKKTGLQVAIATLSIYLFSAQRLSLLRAEILNGLKYDEVIAIQPRINRLATLVKTFNVDHEVFESQVLQTAIETTNIHFISEGWSARAFMGACDKATANLLKLDSKIIPAMLSLIERFPTLSKEELIEAASLPGTSLTPKTNCVSEKKSQAANPTIETPLPPLNESTAYSSGAVNHPQPSLAQTIVTAFNSPPTTNDHSATALLNQIWHLVEHFANATQVDDLVHQCDAMPFGFYIEVQPHDQPNLDFDEREFRHAGWWMLASISGQLNRDWSILLPTDSIWRRAHQNEDPDLTLEYIVQERLGMFCYLTTVAPWLIDPAHPFGNIYFSLLSVLRTLRETAPERFKESS